MKKRNNLATGYNLAGLSLLAIVVFTYASGSAEFEFALLVSLLGIGAIISSIFLLLEGLDDK